MESQDYSETVRVVQLSAEPEKIAAEIKALSQEIEDGKSKHHILDFSSVTEMTSAIFSWLLKLQNILNDQERKLILVNTDQVKGAFVIGSLDERFTFSKNWERDAAELSPQ